MSRRRSSQARLAVEQVHKILARHCLTMPTLSSTDPRGVPTQCLCNSHHSVIIEHQAELVEHLLFEDINSHASNDTLMGCSHLLIEFIVPGNSLVSMSARNKSQTHMSCVNLVSINMFSEVKLSDINPTD